MRPASFTLGNRETPSTTSGLATTRAAISKAASGSMAAPAPRPAPPPQRYEETTPRAEAFLGYSYLRVNPGSPIQGINLNGGSGSIAFNANNWFGIVADFGDYKLSNLAVSGLPSVSADGTVFTYLFGPRLSSRRRDRVTPFVHALFGGAHLGDLISRYSSMPSRPPSRPNPLSLKPPKGISCVYPCASFTVLIVVVSCTLRKKPSDRQREQDSRRCPSSGRGSAQPVLTGRAFLGFSSVSWSEADSSRWSCPGPCGPDRSSPGEIGFCAGYSLKGHARHFSGRSICSSDRSSWRTTKFPALRASG